MKILVSDIRSQKKLEQHQNLDPQSVIWDPPENAHFSEPLQTDIQAQMVDTEAVVNGKLTTNVGLVCGRCLKTFQKSIESHFQQVYSMDDKLIDLTNDIREAVLIELPIYPICKSACKGICPSCGIDKTESTSCSCVDIVKDKRWEKLKELKK